MRIFIDKCLTDSEKYNAVGTKKNVNIFNRKSKSRSRSANQADVPKTATLSPELQIRGVLRII